MTWKALNLYREIAEFNMKRVASNEAGRLDSVLLQRQVNLMETEQAGRHQSD